MPESGGQESELSLKKIQPPEPANIVLNKTVQSAAETGALPKTPTEFDKKYIEDLSLPEEDRHLIAIETNETSKLPTGIKSIEAYASNNPYRKGFYDITATSNEAEDPIGHMLIRKLAGSDKKYNVNLVNVNEAYMRQGVAKAMRNLAAEIIEEKGGVLVAEKGGLTSLGAKFRESLIKKDEHGSEDLSEEQEQLLDLNNTLSEIDSAIKDFDKSNLTSEQNSRLKDIKNKISKSARKLLKIAQKAIVVGAIIGLSGSAGEVIHTAIDYKVNHSALEETVDANGQNIYNHPDARTTHYLNILAGKDRFTDEDLKFAKENGRTAEYLNKLAGFEEFTNDDIEKEAKLYFEGLIKQHEETLPPLPANLGEMSPKELALFYGKDSQLTRSPEESVKIANEITADYARRLNRVAEFRSSTDQNMYDLVWKLEEEGGNPRIRFLAEGDSVFFKQGRANYDPGQNVIYIGIDDLAGVDDGVVAEESHGKQFLDSPFGSFLRDTRDRINVSMHSIISRKGFRKEYDDLLYEKPGTVEYEAHKIIQPQLEEKYPLTLSNLDVEQNKKNLK
jgi:hypothetical protein